MLSCLCGHCFSSFTKLSEADGTFHMMIAAPPASVSAPQVWLMRDWTSRAKVGIQGISNRLHSLKLHRGSHAGVSDQKAAADQCASAGGRHTLLTCKAKQVPLQQTLQAGGRREGRGVQREREKKCVPFAGAAKDLRRTTMADMLSQPLPSPAVLGARHWSHSSSHTCRGDCPSASLLRTNVTACARGRPVRHNCMRGCQEPARTCYRRSACSMPSDILRDAAAATHSCVAGTCWDAAASSTVLHVLIRVSWLKSISACPSASD